MATNSVRRARLGGAQRIRLGFIVAGLIGTAGCVAPPTSQGVDPPNILLVIADDMGFSDTGVTGGEIATPTIDALAAAGSLFTNFHTAPTCSPTRAMLLTGVDHHQAGFGTLAEIATDEQRAQPGYEGFLNARVATIAEVLKTTGYETLYSGKWHIGSQPQQIPSARGFDRAFSLMEGGGNHFDKRGYGKSRPVVHYVQDGRAVELPPNFYSSTGIADKFLEFLGRRDTQSPFFGVVSFTAPHWPLQAPADAIERHESRYLQGWDELRARRFSKQKSLGVIPSSTPFPTRVTSAAEWASLEPAEQRRNARIMAIYAAMIETLDSNLGRVLDALRASGDLDNTVVIFLSDNGPEGRDISGYPFYAKWLRENFETRAPTGDANSFLFTGQGWAQLSATPFRDTKGTLFEGGIRVPLIITDFRAQNPTAKRVTGFTSVLDIVPTVLEVAASDQTLAFYADRAVLRPSGKSLWRASSGKPNAGGTTEAVTGFEYNGHAALVRGRWKAIRSKSNKASNTWALYDLHTDPTESIDLASAQPDRLAEMIDEYGNYARSVGVFSP